MKKFKATFLIGLITIADFQIIHATQAVITVFIKEKIEDKLSDHNKNSSKNISQPLHQPSYIHGIESDASWLQQPGVGGIYASYLGYIGLSDQNGQLTFPRQQQSETMYLLITPEIEPELMMAPALIHHWITKKKNPASFYSIKRKEEKRLHVYYFDVQKLAIPENIPYNTMIIYANPENVNIPVGISLTSYSPHFIIPDMYAKKIGNIKNSLYTLSIKQYFEQIKINSKNDIPNIATMVINT